MPNEMIGGGPGPEWAAGLGGVGQAPAAVPSLLQMAEGTSPFNLPTNNTPEGAEAARQYAEHLQLVHQMQAASGNPQFQPDRNSQDTLATLGAKYTGANDIAYEPGAGGSGFYMGSLVDRVAGRAKPIDIPGVQGDAGRQLGRLPQHLRDAYGPSVVQHILSGSSGLPAGREFPGSLAYMLGVPEFEAGDSFRLNRDQWGRGFGLGSVDSMLLPISGKPRP